MRLYYCIFAPFNFKTKHFMWNNKTQSNGNRKTKSILARSGRHNCGIKSYSRKVMLQIACLATSLFSMILAGCSSGNGNLSFRSSGEAIAQYRGFLSDMRKTENATIERLTTSVKEWRTLNDSVVACLERDTAAHRSQFPIAYRQIRDSICIEFCRMAQSKQRSYHNLFYLKEHTSSFANDTELQETIKAAQPFFASLDTVTLYIKGGKDAVMGRYRSFLSTSLERGIHSKSDLLSFIRDEHKHFLSFLQFLPDFADCGMTDIMHDTEGCCAAILKAEGCDGLSHKDAVVYLSMRTNKRLIANAKMALADIYNGKVKDEECARAYVWMLLQPFMAMDDFSVAVLSSSEKTTMYGIADALPKAFQKLDKLLGDGKGRLPDMPMLLMKVYLTRL